MLCGVNESHPIERFDAIREQIAALREQLARVIIGQHDVIEPMLAALLCQGHVLIVGVPGLAKTLLVRSLADALDLSFRRIQFTPDMMPGDILGTELIQEDPQTGSRSLRFLAGPVFAQLILADEINRTPPRTQAALLEAMAERQVTVNGVTRELEPPFVVVATQNPIEQEGTYLLPEAQLDRFMLSLWMDYPSRGEEVQVVSQTPRIMSEKITPVMSAAELVDAASLVLSMPVSDHVVQYAVDIARASRPKDEAAAEVATDYVAWGAGPRAAQAMVHGAKALAAMAGKPTPSSADIRAIAPHVLRHRIVLNYTATGEGIRSDDVVAALVEQTQEPDYG